MWELTKENYEDRLAAFGVNSVHDLLTNCVYLQDSLIEIDGIKIYGSPWYDNLKNIRCTIQYIGRFNSFAYTCKYHLGKS